MASMSKQGALLGAFLLTSVLLGCGDGPIASSSEPVLQVLASDGLVVFTQNRVPDATMDALFEGTVVRDPAGCLRLASSAGATVVWPHGYTAEAGSSSVQIFDADGALVGTIGESFSIGGGEVVSLTQAMGFTDAVRRASEACPGRYWIVATG